jgi:KDO2-lipid IV(A) lauroyltransferase
LRSYFIYIIARTVIFCIRILPRPVGVFFIRIFASTAYFLDFRHRHIAAVNLKIAFPYLTDTQRAGIARKSFQNTALNLLEISRFPLLNPGNIASLVHYDSAKGLDNFRSAQSQGKGILYMTGHFSAWELLPAAHALYGHPLSFVTRPLDNVIFDCYLQLLRESVGNKVINKKNALRPILKCLKENGSVGILMDQNTSLDEGIFTDLFGLPAATTTGIVLLALRTGAPILPGYLTPMHRGRYTIKFLPPVKVIRTGDKDRDIEINTRMLNKILEGIIREQPESWLWGHKRWKYQPPEISQDIYGLSKEELNRFLESRRNTRQEKESA